MDFQQHVYFKPVIISTSGKSTFEIYVQVEDFVYSCMFQCPGRSNIICKYFHFGISEMWRCRTIFISLFQNECILFITIRSIAVISKIMEKNLVNLNHRKISMNLSNIIQNYKFRIMLNLTSSFYQYEIEFSYEVLR